MRKVLQAAVALAAATGALLGTKSAFAGSGEGVVFVHGTGNYSASDALSKYWTQSSIDKMRNGHSYLVVGYQGASCSGFETCSWGNITQQINSWANANGISSIVVVTHSNGSNPVRYMLAHPTSSTGSSYGSITVSNVTNKIKKVIWLAADNSGTVLADKVTSSGTLAAIANSVVQFFGGGYNNPAVWQQRQDRMNNYNGNGTFSNGSSCNAGSTCYGKTSQYVRGTSVYAAVWSGDAYCGGYGETAGLKATLLYGWGSGGCADGFLGCSSQGYNGSLLMESDRLNHNQSRRSCKGADSAVKNSIYNTIGYEIPADYTISPAAQACNATSRGWSGSLYWYGCTDAMRSDGTTDHDCVASYGGDNGVDAMSGFSSTAYSNPSYYSGGTVCPDSWRGDGICDMCILAKYGYDAVEGAADGADDCVNNGAGTSNSCSDLAYNDTAGAIGTYEYTASH